jgi:hypothetical protein
VTIRIASVPAAHPYVLGIRDADTELSFLPNPTVAGRPAAQWWPPAMIDPRWITQHEHGFDIMHAHFGLESFTIAHLERVLSTLQRAGRPFIYTVHDLVNPQLVDQAHHERQLDVLMHHADALVTLTEGAAAAILDRWGRPAEVIPHPHVLPLDHPPIVSEPHDGYVVGMHLKDLRPNVDAVTATRTLIGAVGMLRKSGEPVTVRIDLDDRVRDAQVEKRVERLCASADFVTLVRHPHLDDEALFQMLSGLDVSVLPYGFGTHSGWLELCWDLGVPVAAPTVGFYAEQHPDPEFVQSYAVGSVTELSAALSALLNGQSGARAETVTARRAERIVQGRAVAERHAELYRLALDGVARAQGRLAEIP